MCTLLQVGNMEATAMHLKSVGALLSRQLSYKNASFELVEVPQAKQKETDYNKAAAFWQELTAEVMHALKSAPTEGGLYTVLEEHEEVSNALY
jgi:P-loop containing NTP hydrolase pore-1